MVNWPLHWMRCCQTAIWEMHGQANFACFEFVINTGPSNYSPKDFPVQCTLEARQYHKIKTKINWFTMHWLGIRTFARYQTTAVDSGSISFVKLQQFTIMVSKMLKYNYYHIFVYLYIFNWRGWLLKYCKSLHRSLTSFVHIPEHCVLWQNSVVFGKSFPHQWEIRWDEV